MVRLRLLFGLAIVVDDAVLVSAGHGDLVGLDLVGPFLSVLRNRLSIICLISLLSLQSYYIFSPANYALDLWLSRDQQGYLYFQLGRYQQAYQRFENQNSKALSAYSGESFDLAAGIFELQHTKASYFNLANSMAHQEQYKEAIDAYQMALAYDPFWVNAKNNLELMKVLAHKQEEVHDFDGGSQGEIGADEIVFDLDGEREKQAEQLEALDEAEIDQDDLRKLWLNRLNTKVEDFLARKFAYQIQSKLAEKESEVDRDAH